MRIGVLDIGTNSIHLLLAEIHGSGTFEVIGREKEMTRLGDGTMKLGTLPPEVMERGLAAIRKFHRLAQTKGVEKIRAVATSAIREASNGGEFLKRVYDETQIRVQIIPGEEEGRLIYIGVKNSLNLSANSNTLIIDIGGGSVEFILGNAKQLLFVKSLKLGVGRLNQLFLEGKKSSKKFKALQIYVEIQLKEIFSELKQWKYKTVIGTSGTFQNLAAILFHLQMKGKNGRFNPQLLEAQAIKKWVPSILKLSPEERASLKGLDPQRQDLILGGSILIQQLFKVFKLSQVKICDKAIREGMVYDYMATHVQKIQVEELVPDVRRRSVLRLMQKFHDDAQHSTQVVRLALQIFDQLKKLHPLQKDSREILEYASLLHDIGYAISFEKHHRHTYYLIKNVKMDGFSEEEIEVIACVARYHRKSFPKADQNGFQNLPTVVQQKIEWLASILRIADALDRTRFSVVSSLKIKITPKTLSFLLKLSSDAQYEIWEALQKSTLLAELTQRKIEFKAKSIEESRNEPQISLRHSFQSEKQS